MTTANNLRIGTRGSILAVWQADFVKKLLLEAHPELTVEIVPIKTRGDVIQDVALAQLEGKSFFTKEIEEALLNRQVDIAVHSGKDVPTELPDGLVLAGFLKRHCPFDAWICSAKKSLAALKPGARVGTSSLRRRALVASLRPDLTLLDLRGNVDTRLKKLKDGQYDAIILAAAGLERLGLLSEVTELLDSKAFPPAVSQGAVAVEIRADDPFVAAKTAPLIDEDTTCAVRAERALLAALEGGCQVPLGALARVTETGGLDMFAALLSTDGTRNVKARLQGDRNSPEALGQSLAVALFKNGGADILGQIRKN
jgi:hydroxymethylbilane synthase